jgi:hypothetical protein
MLSQSEMDDIHASVVDALSFVMIPVTFYTLAPSQTTDPLYGEVVGGREALSALPPIGASVRLKPDEAFLTRSGLRATGDILLFIPRGGIIAWEQDNALSFSIAVGMEVEYLGVRYAVNRPPRTDPLPTDEGQDYIGMVILADEKADTTRG